MKLRQAIKVQRSGRPYRGSTKAKARAVCLRRWFDRRVPLMNFTTTTAGSPIDVQTEYRRALAVMKEYGPSPLRLPLIGWLHYRQFAILPSRRIFVGNPTA